MSSDRTGAVGDATEPARAAANADGGLDQSVADDAQADDPWFAPGPKTAAGPGTPGAFSAADGPVHETDWFLRTGRAGLHPDSETSVDDPSADELTDHHEVRVTAAGAPPWAGETTAVSASTPPPWETGPWPGPGALTTGPGRSRHDRAAYPGSRTATAGVANGADLDGAALDETDMVAGPDLWPARTVVMAGLVPLVVPGLVLGFLSLRQAGSATVRKASWVAIGASLAWAVIIIVIVASVSGGSTAACSNYPAAVHQAYDKALSDLSSNAPASAQEADFETVASLANASAASTGQIGVRTALFALANDMTQARADVVAGRPIPATLRKSLADDGKAPSGSCAT